MIKLTSSSLPAADDHTLPADEEVLSRLHAHPMSGWLGLPQSQVPELERMLREAERIRCAAQRLLVIGAGGSSLGARALISAFGKTDAGYPEAVFWGDNLSVVTARRILERLAGGDFHVILTSKTGSTLETLAAFRCVLPLLREKYGEHVAEHITVISEPDTRLHSFARESGAGFFEFPKNVGGRYSVLCPSGLLPAAVCGVDIRALLDGARAQAGRTDTALRFARERVGLFKRGFTNEILACFEPEFALFGDWWRQLFGESEGKNGGGAYPSCVTYTRDLHSVGQYIQDGVRNLYETFVLFEKAEGTDEIPQNTAFSDGLDTLNGKTLPQLNKIAADSVIEAHKAGGVPVLAVTLPDYSETSAGGFIMFMEIAAAASCFLVGVDPFDQPGVEEYKKRIKSGLK
ncbi:MAG: glucose-6-phosphate isomerase [Oscillospiraceae bacterium]|jgi:glucose-6-phosphate isomerase|nr:glucose-6-phosphate isomerase [Oscillospiraceae bacterium]